MTNQFVLKLSRLLKLISFWLRLRGSLVITTTLLLYAIGVLSLVLGIFGSNEWRSNYVSTTFLTLAVVLPMFAVAAAFAIQIIALVVDAQDREERLRIESRFLTALEKCVGGTTVQNTFFVHLLDQWENSVRNLNNGIMVIHDDYWKVCSSLYAWTHREVECTSSIPLELWDEESTHYDKELIKYYEKQKQELIARGVPVRRTFILEETLDPEKTKLFLKISKKHLGDRFEVYFISLAGMDEKTKTILLTDCALIDNRIALIGKLSDKSRMVYYYEFYDLEQAPRNPELFRAALELFSDPSKILTGQPCAPHFSLPVYRHPLNLFPGLDPTDKFFIEEHVKALRNYGNVH